MELRLTTRTRVTRRGWIVLGAFPALLSVGAAWATDTRRPELEVDGPPAGAVLDLAGLSSARFSAVVGDDEVPVRVTVDGVDATTGLERGDGRATFTSTPLPEGEHAIELRVLRSFPLPDARHVWRFTVDTTPPPLDVAAPEEAVPYDKPVSLTGTSEAGAAITVRGLTTQAGEDGAWSVELPEPPVGSFEVVASDVAGNETATPVELEVALPEVRAVHLTAIAWAVPELRDPVLKMIDEGRITAVELDLKDEAGVVGYDSAVPLANEIGAVQPEYDLADAVADLHARGVRVVGRIVVYRDPILAAWAWDNDRRDWVIQTPDGMPYAKYGGFTNIASPQVHDYNFDLAVEAATAGVDEILWDYVRRPDGDITGMVFPGLEGDPSDAIVTFLEEGRARLQGTGALVGASVFGIAATRPDEIAQDIPRMARHVDYVAPMVYPSHWGPREYGVENPNAQPYDIVKASMVDFLAQVEGTGARVIPWLQDFSLGVTYGPDMVRAQIDAAKDVGIDNWIMWDPKCTYTTAAYDPRPRDADASPSPAAAEPDA